MMHAQRRGYTLVELLIVIALIALLIAILLPALAESRRLGRMAVCVANLQQHAVATHSYSVDYADRIWGFSWRKGNTHSRYPDLQGAGSDVRAAADQAVDILRRRADREDIPGISGWMPHIRYSQLVLIDYLAARLPERLVACPEDRNLLRWQSDPLAFDQGAFAPQPTGKRWPYSSSYRVVPATFDLASAGARISQALSECDGCYIPNLSVLQNAKTVQVHYPSQKVHVYDRHQRHAGARQPFFGLESCRQPLLAFDGSVTNRLTADTNRGWQPNDPTSPAPTIVGYFAQPWDPPTISGQPQELGIGHYRWTRGGLAGLDWGGEEIDTGQLP